MVFESRIHGQVHATGRGLCTLSPRFDVRREAPGSQAHDVEPVDAAEATSPALAATEQPLDCSHPQYRDFPNGRPVPLA
jgi:hypothetical protein